MLILTIVKFFPKKVQFWKIFHFWKWKIWGKFFTIFSLTGEKFNFFGRIFTYVPQSKYALVQPFTTKRSTLPWIDMNCSNLSRKDMQPLVGHLRKYLEVHRSEWAWADGQGFQVAPTWKNIRGHKMSYSKNEVRIERQ